MKYIKSVLFLFLVLVAPALRADDVDVEVSPPEALINESFYVTFKIKITGNTEPYISFTPVGASVQGKREQGVSIQTTVINGKITTTKEQSYVYELIAERQGQVTLKNIKVEIGGRTNSLKDIHINVLSQPRRVADAFMEAQASKTKVYIGEGIDVNYYLYFKTSIAANDIKEFPKLNKFIKRFHHINSPVETVQYKGQVLRRILAYSARVYPEKVGTAVLDPMTISVQLVENDYSSPFGGFGMGSQRLKTKDLSSPRIEVEVLPLPSENVPQGFTGLVGEHEFSLSVSKNKFVVNEPIEIKLEVKGKGALENMDAPLIYTDNNLEQFDTKSEVTELGPQAAKKVFEYTLLARGPVSIKQRELSLSYFDPASGRYVEKKLTIPPLDVSGVAQSNLAGSSQGQGIQKKESTEKEDDNFLNKLFASGTSKPAQKNAPGLVGPAFTNESSFFNRWFDVLNVALALAIAGVTASWFMAPRAAVTFSSHAALAKKEIGQMKSKGMNYSDMYKVLSYLDKQNRMANGGVSINQIVDDSPLTPEAKSYFKSTLQVCEAGSFGLKKANQKIPFEGKHFKELLKHI